MVPAPGLGFAALPGYPAVAAGKPGEDESQGIDVAPDIGLGPFQHFRRSVNGGSGRYLEDGMRAGVGKAEIDELYRIPFVGNQHVGRLQVPVNHLLGVEIAECVTQFVGHLVLYLALRFFLFQEGFQRTAVYPFHFYAIPQLFRVAEGIVLTNVGMVQRIADLELFPQEVFVEPVAAEGRFQAFKDPEAAVPVHLVQFAEPRFGTVNEPGLQLAGWRGVTRRGEECGSIVHLHFQR